MSTTSDFEEIGGNGGNQIVERLHKNCLVEIIHKSQTKQIR